MLTRCLMGWARFEIFLWLWTWKSQFTAPSLELKPLIESLEKNWLQIWSPKIALHPRIETFLWKLWHCRDFAESRKVIVSLCYLLVQNVAVWMITFQFDGRWKRFSTIHDTDRGNFVFSRWLSEINENQNKTIFTLTLCGDFWPEESILERKINKYYLILQMLR